jgi:hypothetical protein
MLVTSSAVMTPGNQINFGDIVKWSDGWSAVAVHEIFAFAATKAICCSAISTIAVKSTLIVTWK